MPRAIAKIDMLVADFLAQKRIAFVGVSDTRETGCNLGYRKFKAAGYQVLPVNPRLTTFEAEPCYPNLRSITPPVDAVFIMTNPHVTDQIVQECVELGIKRVWMHCALGTKPGLGKGLSSVSAQAVQLCHDHQITVIPGSCPNQFLNPDGMHRILRGVSRRLGLLKL